MPDQKPKRDELGEFLTQFQEYFDGTRSYSDLPVLGTTEKRATATMGTSKMPCSVCDKVGCGPYDHIDTILSDEEALRFSRCVIASGYDIPRTTMLAKYIVNRLEKGYCCDAQKSIQLQVTERIERYRYDRGKEDALNGEPPTEGSDAYLKGYNAVTRTPK